MNRRTAIRQVVLITAGASLLPSCVQEDKSSIALKNLSLSGSQENMLRELAETIIPKTSTFPGATDLKAHEFVLTMVDDCHSPEDQQKFTSGLKAFEVTFKKKTGNSFIDATPQQRKDFLLLAEKKQELPEDALQFYGMVKRYTVQGFTSSEKFLTDVRQYKLIPGVNYKGCVPVKNA